MLSSLKNLFSFVLLAWLIAFTSSAFASHGEELNLSELSNEPQMTQSDIQILLEAAEFVSENLEPQPVLYLDTFANAKQAGDELKKIWNLTMPPKDAGTWKCGRPACTGE